MWPGNGVSKRIDQHPRDYLTSQLITDLSLLRAIVLSMCAYQILADYSRLKPTKRIINSLCAYQLQADDGLKGIIISLCVCAYQVSHV